MRNCKRLGFGLGIWRNLLMNRGCGCYPCSASSRNRIAPLTSTSLLPSSIFDAKFLRFLSTCGSLSFLPLSFLFLSACFCFCFSPFSFSFFFLLLFSIFTLFDVFHFLVSFHLFPYFSSSCLIFAPNINVLNYSLAGVNSLQPSLCACPYQLLMLSKFPLLLET